MPVFVSIRDFLRGSQQSSKVVCMLDFLNVVASLSHRSLLLQAQMG